MPQTSPFPPLDIPQTDLLSYLFPPDQDPSDTPIWLDSGDPENNLSPRQLLNWVKRLAVGLDRLGIAEGEPVVIFTPNQIFIPVAYLGIVGSRRVFSGINPNYTASEAAYQLRDTGARALLVYPSLAKVAVQAANEAGLPLSRVFLFSDQPNDSVHGIQDWRYMLGGPDEADRWTRKPMTPSESTATLATLNYSSGTTGRAKGVCITHSNLIANVEQNAFTRFHLRKDRPQERWLGVLPLYHAYGQLYTVLMCVRLHVPVYVMRQFHHEDFLRCIERYKITHLQVAPPMLVMLSKRPETASYDLSSVTDVLCGAAPLSKELQNDVSSRFNVQISQGWGMTETTTCALLVPGGIKDNSGSVGQLISNSDCKLLDDDGNEVGDGEPGELWVRGPQICKGYWRNEEATREALQGGWLKTGDVAICRKGWYWIVDRKKELIKVNGLQVAPAELEAVLLEHDGIADAAVVGITLNGEEWPRAYIQLKDEAKGKVTEKDIHEFMKEKVARHKQPVGGIAFIDEVPKLPSGKIIRKLLKEWAKRDASGIEGLRTSKL